MKIKFNNLDYQNVAVASVVDLFAGENSVAQKYIKNSRQLFGDTVANVLPVDIQTITENMQKIQRINKLPTTDDVARMDFGISMETGTGKTYVYTKTIYELNQKYGFTKFIIVVPSIAIREGVQKSFEITHEHFQNAYGKTPIRWFVYNSSKLADVREFSQSNNIEVMIINIDAFRKAENIIHQEIDKMAGARPIDLIAETNPVVIIDEPQSVANTDKAKEAISWLRPLFILRYSATHREEINIVYRLTPVDAYSQGLVKQISVSSIASMDNFNQAYIKLISVDNTNGYRAKIELDIKTASGKTNRTTRTVKPNDDLFMISGESEKYRDWRITDIDCQPGFEKIELNGAHALMLGQSMGDVSERDIRRGQIRKTIEHHLNKELQLIPKGIKVLSLFFIDRVDKYRIYDGDVVRDGDYAQMFEEEYKKLIKKPMYAPIAEILTEWDDADTAHDGYFSMDKKGKLKDTRGDTVDDQSTYSLIMRDKEKLLDIKNPLRFIFSHSALREGWDNPNVFQVCTLLEQSSSLSARQKIGRGLRLCVNSNGERIYDRDKNLLHIIATESFSEFADKLQSEIESDTGIKFGVLDIQNFIGMDIPVSAAIEMGMEVPEESKQELAQWQAAIFPFAGEGVDGEAGRGSGDPDLLSTTTPPLRGTPSPAKGIEPTIKLGHTGATKLIETLRAEKVIDAKGKITRDAAEKIKKDALVLPAAYQPIGNQIISEIRRADTKLPIRDASREVRARRKQSVIDSAEFMEIWNRISQKTIYRVQMDKEKFISVAVQKLSAMPPIERAKITETTASIDIEKQGVSAAETHNRTFELDYNLTNIPDILGILHSELKLTRATLFEIFKRTDRAADILNNPEKFIEESCAILKGTLAEMLSGGIKYTKIAGENYSAMEVFDEAELLGYLETAIESNKSVYDYITDTDSEMERDFARAMENDPDVKLFFKLPTKKFTIDTPFGPYTPDWAVLLNDYGQTKLYLVIETKGTLDYYQRRPTENAKIDCAKLHFAEIGTSTTTPAEFNAATNWKSTKPTV